MKFLFLSLGFLLTSLCFGCCGLAWKETVLELHPRAGFKEVSAAFRFKNNSDKIVEITNIKTSCGCTTAEMKKKLFSPGESGEVNATLKIGKGAGIQTKTIIVSTNIPEEKPIILTMRVSIPQSLKISPREVVWSKDDPVTEKLIDLVVEDDKAINIVGVSSTHDLFSCRLQTIEAGRHYRISVSPSKTDVSAKAIFIIETNSREKRFFQASGQVR